ncbi:hypothetical protein [Arthrobacter wenxiniae]|uniref:Uncharacterized protein n=1 Tax=Arthrobacter wenxiniae TaxID=2713570 RepID=A0A7Y7IH71_9MICC|nr:hypothetical protein [Arthrobacter wenxiniae]NVM95384.1 hypothetical protein [Arthrobacter wenxiniae]
MQVQSDHGHDTPAAGDSDEAVWRELVARLQEPDDSFMDAAADAGAPAPAGGAAPGASEPGPAAVGGDGRARGVGDFDPLGVWRQQLSPAPGEPAFTGDQDAGGAAAGGPRDYEAEDLDEEFVPGELPSLAGADPAIMLSWIGAAGGPMLLVLAAIFWRGMPLVGVLGVILAFLAGTAYLIYRLPKNRDHDGGDGAVV